MPVWSKIKSFLAKPFIPYLVFALLFIVILLTNWPSGHFLLGWDSLSPEFDFSINWERLIYASWQEYQGLGLLGGMAHGADLSRVILLWPLAQILPLSAVRYTWLFLMILLGGWGIIKLFKTLFFSKESSSSLRQNLILVAVSIFFVFNLATAQNFYLPLETFSTFFAALPWLLWAVLNCFRTHHVRSYLLLLVIAFLASSAFAVQTMFIVFCLVLAIFLVRKIISQRWSGFLTSLKVLAVILIANLFWLIPVGVFTLTNVDATVSSQQNLLSTPENQILNRAAGKFSQLAINQGYWFDYTSYDVTTGQTDYIFAPWRAHLVQPGIKIVAYSLAILSVIGLIWGIIRRPTRSVAITLTGVYILTLIMMSGGAPHIFGWIYQFFYDHVPLFAQIFRTTFTKWIVVAGLVTAAGQGLLLLNLFNSKNKKVGLVTALLAGLFLIGGNFTVSWPLFSGQLISDQMEVDLPPSYLELFAYLQDQPASARILHLPVSSLWGWQHHNWGYQGSGFLWYGIRQPIVDRNFDTWSQANEELFIQLSQAIYNHDWTTVESLLTTHQIDYLLLDHSLVDPNNPDQDVYQIQAWQDFLTGRAQLVFDQEPLLLYQLSAIADQPLHALDDLVAVDQSQPNLLPLIAVDYFRSMNSSEVNIVYPFSYLTGARPLDQITAQSDRLYLPLSTDYQFQTGDHLYLPALASGSSYSAQVLANFTGNHLELKFSPQLNLLINQNSYPLQSLPTLNYEFPETCQELVFSTYEAETGMVLLPNQPQPLALNLTVGQTAELVFNCYPQSDQEPTVSFAQIPVSAWEPLLTEQQFTLTQNDQVWLEVIPLVQPIDLSLLANQDNCDPLGRGYGRAAIEADQQLHFQADYFGVACASVPLDLTSPAQDYLISLQGYNVGGRSLKTWVLEKTTHHSSLEHSLPSQAYQLYLPLLGQSEQLATQPHSYQLNFNNPSLGIGAENVLNRVQLFHLPLQTLAKIQLIPAHQAQITNFNDLELETTRLNPTHYQTTIKLNTSPTGQTILALDQAFNQFWQAKLNGQPLEPVEVNGWAQGWQINWADFADYDQSQLELEINFSLQFYVNLAYLLLGLMAGTLLIASLVEKYRRSPTSLAIEQ